MVRFGTVGNRNKIVTNDTRVGFMKVQNLGDTHAYRNHNCFKHPCSKYNHRMYSLEHRMSSLAPGRAVMSRFLVDPSTHGESISVCTTNCTSESAVLSHNTKNSCEYHLGTCEMMVRMKPITYALQWKE